MNVLQVKEKLQYEFDNILKLLKNQYFNIFKKH